jgi:hypothetical protein
MSHLPPTLELSRFKQPAPGLRVFGRRWLSALLLAMLGAGCATDAPTTPTSPYYDYSAYGPYAYNGWAYNGWNYDGWPGYYGYGTWDYSWYGPAAWYGAPWCCSYGFYGYGYGYGYGGGGNHGHWPGGGRPPPGSGWHGGPAPHPGPMPHSGHAPPSMMHSMPSHSRMH